MVFPGPRVTIFCSSAEILIANFFPSPVWSKNEFSFGGFGGFWSPFLDTLERSRAKGLNGLGFGAFWAEEGLLRDAFDVFSLLVLMS